ncbi:MAG: transcription termination/antitermination NusG family protein, partial [Candidatus Cloacimonetes bacterium]|nr:transcription termination/antitermination NusG family protein [Candidatus Cloacimonadota bacterium]
GELILPQGDSRWMVIHTKPRCEKKLAEYAKQNSITYYLPQFTKSRIYQRRKVEFASVMFPGYVFVIVDHFQKQTLSISGYAVGFIKVNAQQELLEELQNLNRGAAKKADMKPGFWLEKGLEVLIMAGPLKGMKGYVESHSKLSEVHLQVNMLHQAVLVKIDPKDVKVLGEFVIVETES